MKMNTLRVCLLLSLAMTSLSLAAPLKPRVVVLTDISTWETDDHASQTSDPDGDRLRYQWWIQSDA